MQSITKRKYGNLLIYGSFQFSGNTEEYFTKYSKKLVVFILLPRLNNTGNFIRVYKNGVLETEKKVRSSKNFFLYYAYWYSQYFSILLTYFSKKEKVIVISHHPISFLFMSLQKLFRKIVYVYWVADYFPPNSFINKIFMQISYFYHKRLRYKAYLSDTLNKKMNGELIRTDYVKTIMWGVKQAEVSSKGQLRKLSLCFTGVIRPSQGLEETLKVVKDLPYVTLKIIGACDDVLYNQIMKKIRQYNVGKRVFFPNKFYYGKELENLVKDSSIGVALYDVGPNHGTYYADPAKIKTYTQYGLPVLMTDAADIAKYIKKFQAGEVVERTLPSIKTALENMKKNYPEYLNGVRKFNKYFSYEKYYSKHFLFMERL